MTKPNQGVRGVLVEFAREILFIEDTIMDIEEKRKTERKAQDCALSAIIKLIPSEKRIGKILIEVNKTEELFNTAQGGWFVYFSKAIHTEIINRLRGE